MPGDYSRWTFDEHRDHRSVLLQQGRVLLDADWNEQAEVTRWHDEIRMLDTVGRAGGPADAAGFAIVDAAGAAPAGAAWADLRITPGRYYVDGVVAAARLPEGSPAPGLPLPDQPYLEAIGTDLGLPEPAADGRYALYLDIWTHEVTADEDATLLEPALGGPDTSTRVRMVWQVRVVPIADSASCSDLQGADWLAPARGLMTPALKDIPPGSDPCQITTSGGYTRLENQLYRVQIHDVDAAGGARFLWSRENGSVLAGLTGIGPTTVAGMNVALALDRVGRDEELSIGEGDTVEVTSTDLALRGKPGFLATAGPPDGLTLPVAWLDAAPGMAELGPAPVVLRWDAPLQAAASTPVNLEDGITVTFSAGALATGDFWLIPARTVRLVYGLTALSGTLDWPQDASGNPLPATPRGPEHHIAPLAIMRKDATGWTRISDCRRLVPSLTELVSIDLVGGDGQEAPGGTELPQPIRFAVRNGGLPMTGARIRVTPSGGTVTDGTFTDAGIITTTGANGVAAVRWTLDPAGDTTQTLTAQRLDDHDNGVDVQIIATARLAAAVSGRPPGLHVIKADLNIGRPFTNDSTIKIGELVEGITITLDGSINPASVTGKPVVRVVLDTPWATPRETPIAWPAAPFAGSRPIQLGATVDASTGKIVWKPSADAATWLTGQLLSGLHNLQPPWQGTISGRFIIDGWAVVGKDPNLHLNGHGTTFVAADGTTQLRLPTDDDVTGGQFIQWFTLV